MVTTHDSMDADESSSGSRRMASLLIVLIAVSLHVAALFNAQPLQSANDRSRWCTVWSLVERGTFQIDEIRRRPGWDSIDIIHDDGHFYSTKPPLLTVIAAGLTRCVTRVTGWTLLDDTYSVTTAVLLIINILPFAVSLWLLSAVLSRHARTGWCHLFVLSTAAFGTLLTPFLMTFNNHTVAAAGVMVALYALMRLLSDEAPRGWTCGLCGLAAAWACANELPAGAFGLATFLLAWRRSPRQTLSWYVPAALVPLAALIVTNVIATGSWKPAYASYGSSKYNFVIDGVPSYWMNPQGVDRNLDSPLMYFVHCTVGHHGIWSLSPVFLMAIVGWLMSHRVRDPALRSVLRCGAVLTAVVLAFYLTRTQNYNYGGVSCALRWSLWLTPFWVMALIPVLDATARSITMKSIASLLLVASIVSAWLPVPNPWQQPWLFHRMEERGWIDYREEPPPLPRPLWTWFASLPDPAGPAADSPWIEFSSSTPNGQTSRLRLTCRRETAQKDSGLVTLEVSRTNSLGKPSESRTLLIDAARFHAGAAPAEFLRWNDESVTPEQQQADFAFVRGLPLKKEYGPGVVRYLKTPLRRDALRCQRAAAQVLYPLESGNPPLRYRCDVWLCDEVPFGVAQFESKVTTADGSTLLHHERWTVTACQPEPSNSPAIEAGKKTP
ncbi:MAG: hypothetical protein AABP62_19145 [Planctomycetota bacterium]